MSTIGAQGVLRYDENDVADGTESGIHNLAQTNLADVVAELRTAKVAKLRRTTAQTLPSTANQELAVTWNQVDIAMTGAWSSGQPTRLVLPKIGVWSITATARGVAMDANLLRGWLRLGGVELPDSRTEIHGTSGKHQPFIRPAIEAVRVTNATTYVELVVSTESTGGSLAAAGLSLTATWLGN